MKAKIFTITFFSILLFSCAEKENQKKWVNEEKVVVVNGNDTIKNINTKFEITFDNTNHTANLVFNGEKATLKQMPMASGIKYANEVFEYAEWHGEKVLKKKGKIVFEEK